MARAARWSVERGVFALDGEPRLLRMGEYPYFRDDAANWRPRVRAQREAGLDVLATYVPWRHHAPEDPLDGAAYDFAGRTQPNRDLVGFLRICREEGLHVILKPGPFVHAELPFGGLPDYVCPQCATRAIEPERDAWGDPLVWAPFMPPEARHQLPAPFDPQFREYARHWFGALARDALVPNLEPDGCVFAVQLMNEGIYSDSSRPSPWQLGFSESSLARYAEFLEGRYGSIASYRDATGARVERWSDIRPPRQASLLREPRDLLPYLDWSAYQADMYVAVARMYRRFLVDAGMPDDVPIIFNFNPNGAQWREKPASNDAWYTRVNVVDARRFTFGTTDWVGVLPGHASHARQYVMAVTPFRGPSMEQNWGFSSQYFAPYQHATPSLFESALGVACGATSIAVYTFAGTRAWRDDRNLHAGWLPARTNGRGDASSTDYPGEPPVRSTGERTRKYACLRQLAQYLRDEGPRFAAHGPRAEVGWGMYAPYAWAGQWLPRGDPDDIVWRPPLRRVPRGAYHGLDGFVEMMLRAGRGFAQVDLQKETRQLHECDVLCLGAHEFMDLDTQERIARRVEEGGALLLTGVVPERDALLRPARGALADRVFPHRVVEEVALPQPARVTLDDGTPAVASEVAQVVETPADATPLVRLDGRVVGYERRVGRGRAVFVGVGLWRAVHSGDDPLVARMGQDLAWRLVERLAPGPSRLARRSGAEGDLVVWEHACADARERQVFLVVGERAGRVGAEVGAARLEVDSPSQCVHAVLVQGDEPRAMYLVGTNDVRGERVAPALRVDGRAWRAEDACDLCITRADGGLVVSVAHVARTRVHLPVARERVLGAEDGRGEPVEIEGTPDGVALVVRDVVEAGATRVRLAEKREWAFADSNRGPSGYQPDAPARLS